MDPTSAELLKSILNTAERHPNAKVSKLIKCFEVERTPQNIALLLIELAEHPEFSADISISLKYYLDCFKELSQEPSFAEAGIVLYNSSKIYAKRVDHIHHEIERLIISLGNVENIEQNVNGDAIENTVKVKRGRKRALEQINGAIEANMSAKRFKKLTNSKRFEGVTPKHNNFKKTLVEDSEKSMKSYISQSTWQHSVIEDFDYEDEVDSKKNYKLFTYHLEHRYNTLIPDINFKMYFKIKDFINGDCNDSALPESWPPLSDAYIEQFLNLEDVILTKEGHLRKTREKMDASRLKDSRLTDFGNRNTENCKNTNTVTNPDMNFIVNSSVHATGSETQQNMSENESTQLIDCQTSLCESNLSSKSLDSGIGLDTSVLTQVTDESQLRLSESSQLVENSLNISDSGIGPDISTQSPEMYEQMVKDLSALRNEPEIQIYKDAVTVIDKDPTLLDPSKSREEDLSTLKIILPHLSDEGVYFSDLDERDRQMLSPAVVTQDVFRCIKDKNNIVITVDDAIEHLFKIKEPSDEILSLPYYERQHFSLRLNILKIPLKYFNKQRRFKLGPEFNLLKKERLKKYIKRSSIICSAARKLMHITTNVTEEHISPPSSPSYEPDWLGFPEEGSIDKNRTLSRDSGISLHQTDRENIEDFVESTDLLSSTLKPTASDNESSQLQERLTSTDAPEEFPVSLEKPSQSIEEANIPSVGDIFQTSDKSNDNSPKDNQSNLLNEMNEENRVRTKVHEWHNHLQPILACSRERHHFDVFALGTEIMTQFDRNDVCSEKVSFKNVMEEKDESLISRYFLSMLLLANQGNIIIDVQNKSVNEPSELDDIRLKLMTRNRNIVSLEDNIGLRAPPTSKAQIDETPVNAIVRTLKAVPEVPKMDDRDSGIAMSEGSIV